MSEFNRGFGGNRNGGGKRGGFGGGFGGDGGRGGRGGSRGGRGGFGRGGSSERTRMFKTVCDDCGEDCEVPFLPSGDKPVFCNNCFRKTNDNYSSDSRPNRRSDERVESNCASKEDFETLNKKLDKILKLITPVTIVSKEQQAEVMSKKEKAVDSVVTEDDSQELDF